MQILGLEQSRAQQWLPKLVLVAIFTSSSSKYEMLFPCTYDVAGLSGAASKDESDIFASSTDQVIACHAATLADFEILNLDRSCDDEGSKERGDEELHDGLAWSLKDTELGSNGRS